MTTRKYDPLYTDEDYPQYNSLSPGYGSLQNPRLARYDRYLNRDEQTDDSQAEAYSRPASSASNLVQDITQHSLRFDYLSADVIRQMLYERQRLRDKNHADIMSLISDVSGAIGGCDNLRYNPNSLKRRDQLQKMQIDLERQLRDEDVGLWRDIVELKRALVYADRRYQSTRMRTSLFNLPGNHDESKKKQDAMGTGHVSGS